MEGAFRTTFCHTLLHLNYEFLCCHISRFLVLFVSVFSHFCIIPISEKNHTKNPSIKGICLSRNFGHQEALLAGLYNTNADIYVTLEPCCTYGKTPPCTEIIIEKGIKKVVVGLLDPNPLVAGKGIKILEDAGIKVVSGIEEDKIKELNKVFLKYIKTKRPYVLLKTAMTLDGKIASYTGDSKWITNENSRHLVHKLRSEMMGIVTGIGTVKADNPMLNCRLEVQQPIANSQKPTALIQPSCS